ncbi:MAG TPA: C25 family cysteine peptidase [Thermoanaerobaculia bacterium]
MSLQFRISGRVVDRQTGGGVSGVMVRAYDKDLLFDDLLGTATTGADGAFELRYSESDFRELFERRPDVYLSLYESPGKFLLHTKDAIRWNAGTDETFEVQIDRRPATLQDNQAGASLGLPKSALKIEDRGGFSVPRIAGFATGGIPGAPAIPQQVRFVALPLGGDILKIDVEPGEAVRIAAGGPALPAQEPFPDEGFDPETRKPLARSPRMTGPDPRYFEGDARYPEQLVELVRVEEVGPLQMAALQVRPVQYEAATRSYLFYPDLRYTITFDEEKADRTSAERKVRIGEFYAEDLQSMLASDRVAVSAKIRWPIYVLEENPHLIVTDNFQWPEKIANADGTSRAPKLAERGAALTGDLIAEFQRLADWRTAQGMRSKVVSITDIVQGTWGDFTQGDFARDLQEVIRNFLKFAQESWDTRYVVLGGDLNVVPMRVLTGAGGYGTFGVYRTATNPPEEGRNRVAGSVVKIRPQFVPAMTQPLSTYHGGIRIPYNREAGSQSPGWYYTTEADFNTKQSGFTRLTDLTPTRFIIVEGPASIVDDDYYWLRSVNSIPSDFYYASLVGPHYSISGKHDFDTGNNGLYGQSHWNGTSEVTLDGVDFNSDVWVGRVPAETAAQAKAYVDKVMTYEDLRVPGTAGPIDASYLRKIIYAADYWGRGVNWPQADTATPPAEERYTHAAAATLSKVRVNFDITLSSGNPSHRLVAQTGETQTVIPYNLTAHAANIGWYFTTSDSYATQSATPTRFIKVLGPAADIGPDFFFWDPVALELGAHEKENLRGMMNGWWPSFNDVQRHYSDYFDIAPPPALVPLVDANLRAAMNEGAHFVSLTGHGWWGGCCGVNVASEPEFTNNRNYFIAFADSCSTGQPDGVDSAAEVAVIDEKGGAVAYVGNTRYSWIGVGDNYEQFFWCMLRANGRVGPAAGMRLATDGVRSVWTSYAQTLYGDPALRVWNHVPKQLVVKHPERIPIRELLPFEVLIDDRPLADARVTVRGEGVFLSKKTSPDGRVAFALPEGVSPELLEVTVTSREGRMYRAELR